MSFIEIVTEEERNVFQLGESEIYYRRYDSDVVDSLSKKYTRDKGWDKRTGLRRKEMNDKGFNDALLCWIVVDWKNVKHPVTKEDLPCSDEYKKKLPSSVKLQLLDLADSESSVQDEHDDEQQKKTLKTTASSSAD